MLLQIAAGIAIVWVVFWGVVIVLSAVLDICTYGKSNYKKSKKFYE